MITRLLEPPLLGALVGVAAGPRPEQGRPARPSSSRAHTTPSHRRCVPVGQYEVADRTEVLRGLFCAELRRRVPEADPADPFGSWPRRACSHQVRHCVGAVNVRRKCGGWPGVSSHGVAASIFRDRPPRRGCTVCGSADGLLEGADLGKATVCLGRSDPGFFQNEVGG